MWRGHKVYPRVGGGTLITAWEAVTSAIPAWAGVPGRPSCQGLSPRGRGNHHRSPAWVFRAGLSPRGRGNRQPVVDTLSKYVGLSPRGRGNLRNVIARVYPRVGGTCRHQRLAPQSVYPRVGGGTLRSAKLILTEGNQGSIPAWAGEPPQRRVCRYADRVYPRVGGGTLIKFLTPEGNQGLSPRGRGNRRATFR